MTRQLMSKIALVAAAAATVAVLAAPAADAGRRGERPWRERTTGETILDTEACDASGQPIITCPSRLEYDVRANHVGRAELTGDAVSTIDLGGTCTRPDGLTGVPVRTDSDEVIVTRNGSELHAQTIYEDCLVGNGEPSQFTGVRTFTGGTRRFRGATGSVSLSGLQYADGTVEMTGSGTIRYRSPRFWHRGARSWSIFAPGVQPVSVGERG